MNARSSFLATVNLLKIHIIHTYRLSNLFISIHHQVNSDRLDLLMGGNCVGFEFRFDVTTKRCARSLNRVRKFKVAKLNFPFYFFFVFAKLCSSATMTLQLNQIIEDIHPDINGKMNTTNRHFFKEFLLFNHFFYSRSALNLRTLCFFI